MWFQSSILTVLLNNTFQKSLHDKVSSYKNKSCIRAVLDIYLGLVINIKIKLFKMTDVIKKGLLTLISEKCYDNYFVDFNFMDGKIYSKPL